MLFRKKKTEPAPPPPEPVEEAEVPPVIDPRVMETLQRFEKAGVQLLVRLGGPDVYTSEVVGIGRDGFFIDTLSPPEGDRRAKTGVPVDVETLFQGINYTFSTRMLGKVQFIDELPAFKLDYPETIHGERRRKSPRIETRDDASLSFMRPFSCDAPVVNLSEGGLAFDYPAELGRLRPGAVLRDALLELGSLPVVTIQGRVVGNLVAELGGISLPRRYRASLSFQAISAVDRQVIEAYLKEIKGEDVTA